MCWALGQIDREELPAALDATPAGRAVYAPLGFADGFGLTRWVASQPGFGRRHLPVAVRPLGGAADLDRVAVLDAEAFGTDRRQLVHYLAEAAPGRALIAEAGGAVRGFVLARPGRMSLHLGPLVADRTTTAEALVQMAASSAGPVSIDVPDRHEGFTRLLDRAGFAPRRSFVRMVRGLAAPAPETLPFAVAGPEFG